MRINLRPKLSQIVLPQQGPRDLPSNAAPQTAIAIPAIQTALIALVGTM
jgi:hypothetical protein